MKGGKNETYELKRKWGVDIDKKVLENIILGRQLYEKYLLKHNNTSSKDVWKVYDHLTDDIFNEIYSQAM